MEILYSYLIFGGIFCLIGILAIIGAKNNHAFLVDPPEEIWLCWPPSFAKKIGGPRAAKYMTYFLGLLITYWGIEMLWKAVSKFFR